MFVNSWEIVNIPYVLKQTKFVIQYAIVTVDILFPDTSNIKTHLKYATTLKIRTVVISSIEVAHCLLLWSRYIYGVRGGLRMDLIVWPIIGIGGERRK